VRGLVTRAAESCFLLSILTRHHMPRLTARLDDTTRARLQNLKLRDLVCSPEGEAVAAQLISVLVTEHLTASGKDTA
jgi:nuclear pore complex protein Nup155